MRALFVGVVLLALATAAATVTGCATTGKFEAKLRTWEGRSSQAVLNAWGPPQATETLGNGHKMFVYSWLAHPPVAYGESNRRIASVDGKPPKPTAHIECSTFFEIDHEGQVKSVIYRGDACKARN